MMLRAAALLVIMVGCGGGRPGLPPPPPYTPDGTPEPPTACKEPREAAKKAREDVLELGDKHRKTAAAKVLAHAECERKHFDGMPLHDATEPEMLANIRAARDQYNTTANLYKEVIRYNILEFVRAGARLGDLHRAYADKLRATPAPASIRTPSERQAFVANLHRLAGSLDRRAANAYADVLAKVDKIGGIIATDSTSGVWIPAACNHLRRLDRATAGTLRVCGGQ
jgi:hypothetical protein